MTEPPVTGIPASGGLQEITMAGPTQAERRLICALHKNGWTPEVISGHSQVNRAHQAVREVLAEAGRLPPIRPRDIDTGEMEIIADDYKAGMSIRDCAEVHKHSY